MDVIHGHHIKFG